MVFYALIVLLTLIAYGVYRYGWPGKPPHHNRFILGALIAGASAAWCDVPGAETGGMGGSILGFLRLVHLAVLAVVAGGCFAGYKVIQMAPNRRRVPLAWVIGLYLTVYLGFIGHQFYAEAAAVRCDDPAAAAPKKAGSPQDMTVKDIVTASLMYQRICNKGETDLRADLARMLHRWAAK